MTCLVDDVDEREAVRRYVAKNFGRIRYPEPELFWAVILFHRDVIAPKTIQFLHDSWKSGKLTSEKVGMREEDLENLKHRVLQRLKDKQKIPSY
jgi:hypothetical protein